MKDGDGFRMKPDGTPELSFLFYSADQYEIVDTWNTTGLRGTGSHDFEIHDVFVPAGRAIDPSVQRPGYQSGPLYHARFLQIFGWPLFLPVCIARDRQLRDTRSRTASVGQPQPWRMGRGDIARERARSFRADRPGRGLIRRTTL